MSIKKMSIEQQTLLQRIYEDGKITQHEVMCLTDTKKKAFENFIRKNNWDTAKSIKSRTKLSYFGYVEKIEKFRQKYEEGEITIKGIAKAIHCRVNFVLDVSRQQRWKAIATKRNGALRGWAKRRKRLLPLQEIDSICNLNGKPYIYKGILNNKHKLVKCLYTDHTYSNQEIYEKESKQTRP